MQVVNIKIKADKYVKQNDSLSVFFLKSYKYFLI